MARPRMDPGDKLIPTSTALPRRDLAAIERVAASRGVTVARMLRVLILRSFKHNNSLPAESSLTL